MGRIMAIDYGTKKIGIAVTDPLKIIATALTTVDTKHIIEFLKEYFKKEEVECVVVGQPLNLDNSESEMEKHTISFIEELKHNFPTLAVKRIDERFSSVMAQKAILEIGLKKNVRRDKTLVDKVSATILLQSYLDTIN